MPTVRSTTPDPARRAVRRALAASYIGSAVEFYDFFIYGTAAALVFPTVFFPNLSPTIAAVASLASFATAFLARPVGAIVFGHFGDRIGRKQTLMMTLLLMGVSTVAVGLLPSTASIGVAAPAILVGLRLLQGFAVGGEWAGAALLCAENSPRHMRGRSCMVMQLGIGTALVTANLVFLLAHNAFGEGSPAFLNWGWRLPFLMSAILVGVGIYVRRHLDETAEFAGAPADAEVRLPIADLLRRQTPQLLLGAGAVAGVVMLLYQASTFLTAYAETHLQVSKPAIFAISAFGGLCLMAGVTASGFLTDAYGHRRVAMVGYAVAVPWSFAILPLIQTGDAVFFAGTLAATYALVGLLMSPLTALLPGVFAMRNRYTGAALANNLGAILGGAVPPVISPLLMTHGDVAVGLMMFGFALLSLLSVGWLREGETPAPTQSSSSWSSSPSMKSIISFGSPHLPGSP